MREFVGEIGLDNDLASLQFAMYKREHLANDLIDVELDPVAAISLDHRPDASDHLNGAMAIIDDPLQGLSGFVEGGCRVCKPAQARIAIHHDRRQRLVDFMSDGGGDLTDSCHPCRMSQSAFTLA